MRSLWMAATAAGLMTFAVPASRADALADAVAGIPGAVEEVQAAGHWTEGDANGIYRVVVARTGNGSGLTARLFVQWIAYGPDGASQIAHSVEITELAALGVDIVNVHAETDADGLAVFVDTLSTTDDSDQLYELFVVSPDEYRFGPATN